MHRIRPLRRHQKAELMSSLGQEKVMWATQERRGKGGKGPNRLTHNNGK
jgi:hypothetical protein